MKSVFNILKLKIYRLLPAMALLMAAHSITSTCCYWIYQPNIPPELLEKYNKKYFLE